MSGPMSSNLLNEFVLAPKLAQKICYGIKVLKIKIFLEGIVRDRLQISFLISRELMGLN